MTYVQSVRLIFERIIQVEEMGGAFYRRLSQRTHAAAVREVFALLSADEDRHKKDFMELSRTFSDTDHTFDSPVNLMGILDTMLDRLKQSMKGSEPLDTDSLDLSKALHIGIENEKAAVAVYTEMAKITSLRSRLVFEKIAAVEQEHLDRLLKIRESRLA